MREYVWVKRMLFDKFIWYVPFLNRHGRCRFVNIIGNENELGRDVLLITLHVILAVNSLPIQVWGLSSFAEPKVVNERYYVSETCDETFFPSAILRFFPFHFIRPVGALNLRFVASSCNRRFYPSFPRFSGRTTRAWLYANARDSSKFAFAQIVVAVKKKFTHPHTLQPCVNCKTDT